MSIAPVTNTFKAIHLKARLIDPVKSCPVIYAEICLEAHCIHPDLDSVALHFDRLESDIYTHTIHFNILKNATDANAQFNTASLGTDIYRGILQCRPVV